MIHLQDFAWKYYNLIVYVTYPLLSIATKYIAFCVAESLSTEIFTNTIAQGIRQL